MEEIKECNAEAAIGHLPIPPVVPESIMVDLQPRYQRKCIVSTITVKVPPGELGIILKDINDIPTGMHGGTFISHVNTDSVLAQQVSIGDSIITIDGKDVSQHTDNEISSILSYKANNAVRVLVIAKGISSVDYMKQQHDEARIKTSPNKAKRPANAYILYGNTVRQQVKDANPELKHTEVVSTYVLYCAVYTSSLPILMHVITIYSTSDEDDW